MSRRVSRGLNARVHSYHWLCVGSSAQRTKHLLTVGPGLARKRPKTVTPVDYHSHLSGRLRQVDRERVPQAELARLVSRGRNSSLPLVRPLERGSSSRTGRESQLLVWLGHASLGVAHLTEGLHQDTSLWWLEQPSARDLSGAMRDSPGGDFDTLISARDQSFPRTLLQEDDRDDGPCEDGNEACPACGRPMRLLDRRDKPSWFDIMTSMHRPRWYGHDSL